MPKVTVLCDECGKNITRPPSLINKTNFCCQQHHYAFKIGKKSSPETKAKLQKITAGKNNPNYGNKWSDKQKQKQSEIVKEAFKNPIVRYKAGSANRGKKFSNELVQKMHGHRTKESYIHGFSEEVRKLIGRKSAEKFTPEFKIRLRKKMEDGGWWIPKNQKSDYEIYRECCAWTKRMFDRCTLQENTLLNNFGVFNCKTNPKGCVRDHKFSIMNGFLCRVFPIILRHPCNCEIITHSKNVSKIFKNNGNSISLKKLMDDIDQYTGNWKEQNICLEKIQEYRKESRWENPYIQRSTRD